MFCILPSPAPFPLSLPGRSQTEAGAFQLFPDLDFARTASRHFFRDFVLAQTRLPWRPGLWHQSGMAKSKKNAAAVALGRLGGLKGGKARARKMTAAQRKRSARKAARARWATAKRRK
jgi:hypothetical protein